MIGIFSYALRITQESCASRLNFLTYLSLTYLKYFYVSGSLRCLRAWMMNLCYNLFRRDVFLYYLMIFSILSEVTKIYFIIMGPINLK